MTNALDLSETEEEAETENLLEYFLRSQDDTGLVCIVFILTSIDNMRPQDNASSQKFYFFQFPSPFPQFESGTCPSEIRGIVLEKHVSFAPDTNPSTSTTDEKDPRSDTEEPRANESHPSGEIGLLEVYESGIVRIRLGGEILYDVSLISYEGIKCEV